MAQGQISGQPMVVSGDRILGRDAQRTNIAVAYAVASAVKTTLGPRGMDKMMVSDLGDIVITNDGATILNEMNVEHPAAKMMVEVAKTQDEEVGDGTTSAVVLSGELLKNALDLLDQDIHASTIISGYKSAASKAIEELYSVAETVGVKDTSILEKIASVSMGSKTVSAGEAQGFLAKMVVSAVTQVAEHKDGKIFVDKDYIKIEKKQGGDVMQ
ncbi:MAG TPA: TCP-1/cpn60 chaperonin family protein, partial [Candidatus Norongarragalinales archaeon]|nr:TCP-1/cpn60 chaperonin family protein [Candidatus Norongarragalinales archaeon]